MTFPILSVKNLAVSFNTFEGEAKIIDYINLYVGEKETVGLVGETGCGKSVTLKAILGILPIPPGKITNGQILFRGKNRNFPHSSRPFGFIKSCIYSKGSISRPGYETRGRTYFKDKLL